jgi:hypothetical protein
MVGEMRKRLFISFISVFIAVDVIFMIGLILFAHNKYDRIEQYLWFEKYANMIEEKTQGQIRTHQISMGGEEIMFRYEPGTTPADCYAVVEMIHDWRQSDARLDRLQFICFVKNGSEGTQHHLLMRVGLSQWGLGFYGLNKDNRVFDQLLVSGLLNEEYYRLSSYSDIDSPFRLFTQAYIEFDDDLVFSKITAWDCAEGLYTADQLSAIESKGIPVTVWKEDIS